MEKKLKVFIFFRSVSSDRLPY